MVNSRLAMARPPYPISPTRHRNRRLSPFDILDVVIAAGASLLRFAGFFRGTRVGAKTVAEGVHQIDDVAGPLLRRLPRGIVASVEADVYRIFGMRLKRQSWEHPGNRVPLKLSESRMATQ